MSFQLRDVAYNKGIRMLENTFTKNIVSLSKQASKNTKLLSIGMDDGGAESKSAVLLDIRKLPSLTEGYPDLEGEIAAYRQEMLKIPEINEQFLKKESNRRILFIDYMLTVALCRVEIIEKGTSRVSSYYATRNIKIAAGVTGESEASLRKHVTFLSSKYTDYIYKDLKILRLSSRKDGFVINSPEAHLIYDETKTIKVIPIVFITNFVDGLLDTLSTTVQEITHITDKGRVEKIVTTLNKGILQKVFTNEEISNKFKHSGYVEQESIIRLPELETSRYSEKGVQEVNITRILSIKKKTNIDIKYRDIDFEGVLPTMIITLESTSRENISEIYQDMKIGDSTIYMEQKRMINTYVNNTYSHEGESYIKRLHDYMVSKPTIFEGYTGKKD